MAGKEIEEIKKKIDLAEFIGGYVDLQPAGKILKALCPFHGEKTPSFVVSPERGRWHCFGSCQEGGDIFTFLMKYENIEFYEALQILAERAGVELQRVSPETQREFGVLYAINEEAKTFYAGELKTYLPAQKYLKGRGVTGETAKKFELGYAPGGEALTLHLLAQGYDVHDLERAGVTHKNRKGMYWDKFQKRIIFPIMSSVGKTVAFTGRILPDVDRSETMNYPNLRVKESEVPKYLNSPETPIFHKSKVLYGHHLAKKAIGDAKTAFLVEGQMDVVMAHQAGVENAIAVSGTGLTPHHLEKLRRAADTIVLSFDNDEAGVKAMERALDIFSHFDFHVQVIDLREYKDPADAVVAQPTFLQEALGRAQPAFPRLFEKRLSEVRVGDVAGKKRVIREMLAKLKSLKSATEQDEWIRELSRISGVREEALRSEFGFLQVEVDVRGTTRGDIVRRVQDKPVREQEGRLERVDKICRRILLLASHEEALLKGLQGREELLPERYRQMLEDPETQSRVEMAAAHELGSMEPEVLRAEFEGLLRELRLEFLKKQREEVRFKIREFERSGREEESLRFLDEFQKISMEMESIKKVESKN